MFHIPSIFALNQLKISEIYVLFQPIRLHIFCILLTSVLIMKVSYIYSRTFENLKVSGLQRKSLSKLYFSSILPIFSKHNFSQCVIRACK